MALAMFLFFVGVTLVITYWAARRTSGANAFFAANRRIKGWQNGFAVAGDYMSAASFLGIAGIIAFQGYDGFMYLERVSEECARHEGEEKRASYEGRRREDDEP